MSVQLAWALVHFLWQGLAIAGILLIVLQLLRDAANRYRACAAALGLMALAPVATFLWLAPHTTKLGGTPGLMLDTADLPALGPVQTSWLESHATWLLTLWLAGACLLLMRAVAAWLRARRLVTRQLTPLPPEIDRAAVRLAGALGVQRVRFHASARVASALVFGWLKPVIVLPAAAIGRLSEAEIEALLAHELAHVMRQDFLVNLLQTFAECALFYHPCVWWVSARMRHERELCCDDVAVAVCRDEVLYSKALLRLEELRMEPALAATGGRLRERIRRLLNTPETRRISAAPVVALALLIGVSVALLAQNPPPPPEPPAPPPAAAPAKAPVPPAAPVAPAPPADPEGAMQNGQAPPPPPPAQPPPPPDAPPPPPPPPAGAPTTGGPRAPQMPPGPTGHGPSGAPGPGPRSTGTAMQSAEQFREQRAAMEKARKDMEVQRQAMEKNRKAMAAERASMEKARQQMEVALKEQAAKLQSDLGPEARKKMEELRQRMEALAKDEAEKALLEADQARQEAELAAHEADLARREAEGARAEADQARHEAEIKRLEAERSKVATKEEIAKRREFAKEHCGGEDTDCGRIVMQYGLPDQREFYGDRIETQNGRADSMKVYGSRGEAWRYESHGQGGAVLDFQFDGSGKLVRRSGGDQARVEQERRVKYANEKWAGEGGANSAKRRAYVQYGPPDEIRTETGLETWLYKTAAKDQVRMEVTFDTRGKLQGRESVGEHQAELERRVAYAEKKWASQGGAHSDKGKAYIKYGPPDEIRTEAGGETWLYKNEAKDRVWLEVTFDANGKGKTVKKISSAGPIGSSLSWRFQEAPDLR